MFKFANDELKEIAQELYEKHKTDLNLTVDPSKVVFLRSDRKKNAYAYCKLIRGEYELLSDKKFFIVIVSENYDNLQSEDQRKYVILHELKHLHYDEDKDKYHLLKHNIEDFHQLLINPNWNISLVKEVKHEV